MSSTSSERAGLGMLYRLRRRGLRMCEEISRLRAVHGGVHRRRWREQITEVARLEDALHLLRVSQHIGREELLEDLALVHLLLERAARDEPVDGHRALLAHAVGALARLHVVGRVPVGVD